MIPASWMEIADAISLWVGRAALTFSTLLLLIAISAVTADRISAWLRRRRELAMDRDWLAAHRIAPTDLADHTDGRVWR